MSRKPVHISSKQQLDGILSSTSLVIADFYADWCAPCKQIAPYFEKLSESLSSADKVAFVKVNNEEHGDIASEYQITVLPTFIIFKSGKVAEKVQGANPQQLSRTLEKLMANVDSINSSSGAAGGSGNWKRAEIPRGYSDITDQVETKGCELLNAEDDAGPVRTLFQDGKPSGKAAGPSADWVQSGSDDQLLLFVPFQATVKLHTLQLTSVIPKDIEEAPSRPSVLRLFINRTANIDFDEADEAEPTQEIEIGDSEWNSENTASIPLRYVKFQKTTTLILYVQKGDGEAETVRLDRIRFIGEAGPQREMGKLQKIGDDPGE